MLASARIFDSIHDNPQPSLLPTAATLHRIYPLVRIAAAIRAGVREAGGCAAVFGCVGAVINRRCLIAGARGDQTWSPGEARLVRNSVAACDRKRRRSSWGPGRDLACLFFAETNRDVELQGRPVCRCPVSVVPDQRSRREIPNRFILAFNVVRGMPRREAVALTTPSASR